MTIMSSFLYMCLCVCVWCVFSGFFWLFSFFRLYLMHINYRWLLLLTKKKNNHDNLSKQITTKKKNKEKYLYGFEIYENIWTHTVFVCLFVCWLVFSLVTAFTKQQKKNLLRKISFSCKTIIVDLHMIMIKIIEKMIKLWNYLS